MRLHDIACHGIQPDLTVYIDIDLDTSLERARSRKQAKLDRMEDQEAEILRPRSQRLSAAGRRCTRSASKWWMAAAPSPKSVSESGT